MASAKEVESLQLMDDPLEAFAQTYDVHDNHDDEGHLVDEHDHTFSPPHALEEDNNVATGEATTLKKAPAAVSSPKQKRKRPVPTFRKNPDAPRRFKSSYICFFTAKQGEIKESLGGKATVKEISGEAAQIWKDMPANERSKWDDIAAKDKERYMKEKAAYTGPWQVPNKRMKKDPSAPKRPMSAFLLFSQGRRTEVRTQHPGMKNTEVSRVLGELWRGSTEEEKMPFVQQEKSLREKYKVDMEEWKEKAGERKEEEMKRQTEQLVRQRQQYEYAVRIAQPQQQHNGQQQSNYYGQAAAFSNPSSYQLYPQGNASMYQQAGYQSQYANYSQPGGYQYPSTGKQQSVILGSNGMPYYPPAPQQQVRQSADDRDTKLRQNEVSNHSQHAATPVPAFDAAFGSGYLDLDS